MTEEEILKGNKLMAEFMGGKVEYFNITKKNYYKGLSHGRKLMSEELSYNEQWEWLMPVVEKIQQQGFRTNISYDEFNKHGFVITEGHHYTIASATSSTSAISAVWKGVFYFLKAKK